MRVPIGMGVLRNLLLLVLGEKQGLWGENLAENYIKRETFARWGSLPEVIRSLDSKTWVLKMSLMSL